MMFNTKMNKCTKLCVQTYELIYVQLYTSTASKTYIIIIRSLCGMATFLFTIISRDEGKTGPKQEAN